MGDYWKQSYKRDKKKILKVFVVGRYIKMKALHLGWVTDSLKTILALRHSAIEPVVVNTDPIHFFDRVPALFVDIPVRLNLYQNFRIPYPYLFRHLLVSPLNRCFPFSRQLVQIVKRK